MVLEQTCQLEQVRLIYLFMALVQEVEVVVEEVEGIKVKVVMAHPSFLGRQ